MSCIDIRITEEYKISLKDKINGQFLIQCYHSNYKSYLSTLRNAYLVKRNHNVTMVLPMAVRLRNRPIEFKKSTKNVNLIYSMNLQATIAKYIFIFIYLSI